MFEGRIRKMRASLTEKGELQKSLRLPSPRFAFNEFVAVYHKPETCVVSRALGLHTEGISIVPDGEPLQETHPEKSPAPKMPMAGSTSSPQAVTDETRYNAEVA